MGNNITVTELEEVLEEVEKADEEKELKINLKIDEKKTQEAMKNLEEAFSGVRKKVESIANGIQKALGSLGQGVKTALSGVKEEMTEAFTVTNLEEYNAAASRFGEGLARALYSVHENMCAMETAIVDAVAPMAAVVVPVVSEVLQAVTDMVNGMGQAVGDLFGKTSGADAMAQSVEAAATAVAGAIGVLQMIDLTNITTAFRDLQAALIPLTQELFAGLEWAYLNVLVPLAAWTTEGILPGFLNMLSGAMKIVSETLSILQPHAAWLLESFLQPVAQWTGGVVVDVLQLLAGALGAIGTWISENQPLVEGIALIVGSVAAAIGLVNTAMVIANAATAAWTIIAGTGAAVTTAFGAAMSVLTSPITLVVAAIAAVIGVVVLLIKNWDTVKAAAISAWESIKEAFGKAWTWFKGTVVDPLVNGFKGAVNGVIGFINGLIAGVVKGINSIVQMLNSLKFTVPDWVPGLGGQALGFHLKTVTTPQIPYLAKGAVLPANKPFLAMVGDQRHGTNIEAPLATIQEAVAMTMEDFAAGNMAGHQATVAVLREILEAVLGIHISDTEIGRAAERYQSKMAIARGSMW